MTNTQVDAKESKKVRKDLAPPPVHARYDAAQDTDEFKNYWANTDALDADSAHSKGVRQKLVQRSRYEVGNNGYSDGMLQTHCNYLVGKGPQLRMETASSGFNSLVENEWRLWAKAVQFRRKLWTQSHAKVQDGEGFGLATFNPRIKHPVKIDYKLLETEQVSTPYLPPNEVGYIDGIRFDDFGNPVWYDILPFHPGGAWSFQTWQQPDQVAARFVMHWFQMRRPGQHRAVPEFKSTLNVGAASRRWREATVSAAETAAMFTVLLKTQMAPDDGADLVSPLSTVDLQKRLMTALPMGWDAGQMKAEHPNAQYSEFHRAQINEQGRPKSMPVNVAAADSSQHNFASGKLDHLSWFIGLGVEREDGTDLVLDPLFSLWFREASLVFGWSGDPDAPPRHSWDWPVLPVADEKAKAAADDTNLRNGSATLSGIYAAQGRDFSDEIEVLAEDYGLATDDMRALLRQTIFGPVPGGSNVEEA